MEYLQIPADVSGEAESLYRENFGKSTGGSGRLMLFAGEQRSEG